MKNVTIAIMGATGDLAQKKLLPAIASLARKNNYYKINLVAVGRRELSSSQYCTMMRISQTSTLKIHYLKIDFDSGTLEPLYNLLEKIEDKNTEGRLFYLSTEPKFFGSLSEKLSTCCIDKNKFNRLLIEKPFGFDLQSSIKLNNSLARNFSEEQIFRVDHYLGKETVQNILILRMANPFFERTWNSNFIDSINITVSEDEGVESRLEYYDSTGALRDMIQNHMLQVLSFILMDTPKSTESDDIHEKKVEAIKSLFAERLILGQYKTYSDELAKHKIQKSKTETFARLTLKSRLKRWSGTKIILSTGKMMHKKFATIEINYKKEPCNIYCDINTFPNKLLLHIQPKQDVSFYLNIKEPGADMKILHSHMNFSKDASFLSNSPESYEVILDECIRGLKTIFIARDELEASWKLIDRIRKKMPVPIIYEQGTNIEDINSEEKKKSSITKIKKYSKKITKE